MPLSTWGIWCTVVDGEESWRNMTLRRSPWSQPSARSWPSVEGALAAKMVRVWLLLGLLGVTGLALTACSSGPSAGSSEQGAAATGHSTSTSSGTSNTGSSSAGSSNSGGSSPSPKFPFPCSEVMTPAQVSAIVGFDVELGSPNNWGKSGNTCNYDSYHNQVNDLTIAVNPYSTPSGPGQPISGLGPDATVSSGDQQTTVRADFASWSLYVSQSGGPGQPYSSDEVVAIAQQAYKNILSAQPSSNTGSTGSSGTTGSTGNS